MFSRFSYEPLNAGEDAATSEYPAWVYWYHHIIPRRKITVIVGGLFILAGCALLLPNPQLQERLKEYVHANSTSVGQPMTGSDVASTTSAVQWPASSTSNDAASTPFPPQWPASSTSSDVAGTASAVQWSDFAYVQYVTNAQYLCNSLMIFEALRRHNTKADLLMMYDNRWQEPTEVVTNTPYESRLLLKARDEYKANLVPIQVQTFIQKDDPTWEDSYTKLLAFNQTQYKRLVSLDSDATVLDNMDELFLLPSAPIAMPRAYWLDQPFLSSQVVVIEPSGKEWKRVQKAMDEHKQGDYDMDILNNMYGASSTVIPHRKYDLLSAEFNTMHHDSKGEKKNPHEKYLGAADEAWDARAILEEAKYVHFSDWPMPKPWIEPSVELLAEHQPKCVRNSATGNEDCTDRDIWLELRNDFSTRRERICGMKYGKRDSKPLLPRSETSYSVPRSKYEPVFW